MEFFQKMLNLRLSAVEVVHSGNSEQGLTRESFD